MDVFYWVTMQTKTGKTLYFCDGNKWEFSKVNAIWFESQTNAEKFCKEYFKNFKNYKIVDFKYNINTLQYV